MSDIPHARPHGIVTEVAVEYQPPGAAPPLPTEVLWSQPLGHHRYQIRSIPFWVNGVSRYDVVEATRPPGAKASGELPLARRLVKRSGHSTYRCIVHDGLESPNPPFDRLWSGLAAEGCSFETLDPRFIAIDVPPGARGPVVDAIFAAGEHDMTWTVQEGLDEHPTAS